MPKGVPSKHCTPEFKRQVVETIHKEYWGYVEAGTHFYAANQWVCEWERIYWPEGPDAFAIEHRGQKCFLLCFLPAQKYCEALSTV